VTHAAATPPAALVNVAARFGLEMSGELAWIEIDRDATRFDWSVKTAQHEILWSFWMETIDPVSAKYLQNTIVAAAGNLSETQTPCGVFDQPAEIVGVVGVDRIITVCFDPNDAYGKGVFHRGVMHGIVKNGTLSIVVVLSNDRSGVVPLPSVIGARGKT
jgi:hypothetical protein